MQHDARAYLHDEIVWDIIENHLPDLIHNCRVILDD